MISLWKIIAFSAYNTSNNYHLFRINMSLANTTLTVSSRSAFSTYQASTSDPFQPLSDFETAFRNNPECRTTIQSIYIYADKLLKEKPLPKAVEHLHVFSTIHRNNCPVTLAILAHIYLYKCEDSQKALDYASQSLKLIPNNYPAILIRGQVLSHSHKTLDNGLKDLNKAATLNPCVGIFEICTALSNTKIPLETINAIVKKDPDNSVALAIRGHVHLRNQTLGDSQNDLNKSIKLNPNNPIAYAGLAYLELYVDDYAEALSYAAQNLEFEDPSSNVMARLIRSHVYRQQDDLNLALQELEEVFKIDPENEQALMLKEELLKAK